MRRWSERHLRVYLFWLAEDMNRPDRGDHYLMQINQAVAQIPHQFSEKGKPGDIKMEHFRLAFGRTNAEPEAAGDEEAIPGMPQRLTAESKARLERDILLSQIEGTVKRGPRS